MFEIGKECSPEDIHRVTGGSKQAFPPIKGGRVVAARVRQDLNPHALEVIVCVMAAHRRVRRGLRSRGSRLASGSSCALGRIGFDMRANMWSQRRWRLPPITRNSPERIVERMDPASLPVDWREISARGELQQVGARWSQTRASAVLAVPSAVVPAETNYLLHPNHTDFAHVQIGAREEWLTDTRLLRRAAAPASGA